MISRKEAREAVYGLLFETEFKKDEKPEDIFAVSCEEREIPEDDYIRDVFFGVLANLETIDALASKYSNGWKTNRMTVSSRTIIRLATYEMKFVPQIPHHVSLNEAIELAKKYDDEKAKGFINGVLNSIKDEIEKEDGSN